MRIREVLYTLAISSKVPRRAFLLREAVPLGILVEAICGACSCGAPEQRGDACEERSLDAHSDARFVVCRHVSSSPMASSSSVCGGYCGLDFERFLMWLLWLRLRALFDVAIGPLVFMSAVATFPLFCETVGKGSFFEWCIRANTGSYPDRFVSGVFRFDSGETVAVNLLLLALRLVPFSL